MDKKTFFTFAGGILFAILLIGMVALAKPEAVKAQASVAELPQCTYNESEAFGGDNVFVDCSRADAGYIAIDDESSEKNRVFLEHKKGSMDYPTSDGINYIPLQYGSGKYTISICSHISGNDYRIIEEKVINAKIDETTQFLLPIDFVDYKSDDIADIAGEIANGKSPYEAQMAMASYVHEHITYDDAKAAQDNLDYISNPEETLKTSSGICIDFATLYASMCRSQGYPCKVVSADIWEDGELYGHAWNQILIDGEWVDIDCCYSDEPIEQYDGVDFYYY